MKIFVANLRSGKEIEIEANSYHRDNEQYVFVGADDKEVQFVICDEVVSITEHRLTRSRGGRGW